MCLFYLGTHRPEWLAKTNIPLFVSRRRLRGRKTFPRATTDWALDSGGFSELSLSGTWTIGSAEYIREVYRYRDEIGRLQWAASMDWMCEPWIIEKTGLSVGVHQARTVQNYLLLRERAPDLPWVPVLQGWSIKDYWRHIEMYQDAGIELANLERIGLGSVCRRQHTKEVEQLIRELFPLRLHGFGFKLKGLANIAPYLQSADSMAWSMSARRQPPLAGCVHKNCANCYLYAEIWYQKVMRCIRREDQ